MNSEDDFNASMDLLAMPNYDEEMLAEILKENLREANLPNETCEAFANSMFCDDRPLYHLLMGRVFMLMLILCVFGNCVNLIIYFSEQMRQFLAIRVLSAKVLLNSLLMACLLPQALRFCQSWSSDSDIEEIYWQTWPFQMYLINVLGFCSMWVTVLITFEYYVHVAFPTYSKSWWNGASVCKCSAVIVLTAISLHSIYPINRIIRKLECPGDRVFYQVLARPDAILVTLEKTYAWLNLLLAIVLPLALLTFMSIYIAWRLLFKRSSFQQHHLNEKTCVTRITLVTTMLQIICEGPTATVFVIAAVAGPDMNDPLTCYCNTVAHFLGLCNLSLAFFIYLIFSDRFRSLVAMKFENCLCVRWLSNFRGGMRSRSSPNEKSTLLHSEYIRTQFCVKETSGL